MTVTDSSTNRMITSLKPGTATAITNSPGASFVERLRKLNLGNDPQMIALLEANPDYGNRLISLFKVLKELEIDLTDGLARLIANNISQIGRVVNLLELIKKEVNIDPRTLSMPLLFNAAPFDEAVAQSVRDLTQGDLLDPDIFKLLLAYPAQAHKISQLLINLQERAYESSALVEKLNAVSITAERMDTVINLLDLVLENNLFYPEMVDILLRQEAYIDRIYEGATKLIAEHSLFPDYFAMLEANPKNANIFAKNILLLRDAQFINFSNPECLAIVSQLGIGAFHFMKILHRADQLNEENFEIVCQKDNILNREEVIDELSRLPLLTEFDEDELEMMLCLVAQTELSDADVEGFNSIIRYHHIFENQCAASVSLS
ncbi:MULTISPECIES: hypothetical protein [Legionella]|uniref:hypothetical protein n=1 Tax=Legionella TaxID=445 RepID=UPI0009669B61|nr:MULTISPECIES: hypothetical protein [Legionella]MBN9226053.1 hypothetical protein [Legionella steelei]OJW16598.1 MAG: hypothetical protein BGO44_00780 [Legionella sp. 39-23]